MSWACAWARCLPRCCARAKVIARGTSRSGISCTSRIACPTLIVHAREDELTSLRSARRLQREIPHAEVDVLENSYHMIGSDNDRKMVASRVRDFLLAHPAALPASR